MWTVHHIITSATTLNTTTNTQWLWDFRAMVSRLHAAWWATPWSDVKTEALVEQNKDLLKQLRRQGNDHQACGRVYVCMCCVYCKRETGP